MPSTYVQTIIPAISKTFNNFLKVHIANFSTFGFSNSEYKYFYIKQSKHEKNEILAGSDRRSTIHADILL